MSSNVQVVALEVLNRRVELHGNMTVVASAEAVAGDELLGVEETSALGGGPNLFLASHDTVHHLSRGISLVKHHVARFLLGFNAKASDGEEDGGKAAQT